MTFATFLPPKIPLRRIYPRAEPVITLARWLVAATWIYQGLFCKVLGLASHHLLIFQAATGLPSAWAQLLLLVLGSLETALGVWVLCRVRSWAAAWTQTLLLVAMNSAGLLTALESIPDPIGMIFSNLMFLTLVWTVARNESEVTHVAP